MDYRLDVSMMFAMRQALRRQRGQVGRIAGRRDDDPATRLLSTSVQTGGALGLGAPFTINTLVSPPRPPVTEP